MRFWRGFRMRWTNATMTEALLALVSDWGALALAVATFLSCLAVPVPTSVMMLAAGAFVATGDLGLASVLGSAYMGAILGDQAGFFLGRIFGAVMTERIRRHPGRARLLHGAEAALHRHGAWAVFLSRWLFSPLGPYVNAAAGFARMRWGRFTTMSALGEGVWVALYTGLGFVFAGQLGMVADVLGNSVGLLTSGLIAVLAGVFLFRKIPRRRRARP